MNARQALRMETRVLVLGGVIGLAALLAMLVMPGAARAAEFRAGGSPSLSRGERIDDDLYIAGGTITVAGDIARDLTVTGGTVVIAGTVGGNLMVAGGTVTVDGPIGGSVRVLAGNATIRGPVGWDVLVAGGEVTLASASQVRQDVWAGAGTLIVDGTVGRDLRGSVGSLRLNGAVGRDVRVEADQTVRLGPGARVSGDLEYASDETAVIDPSAMVGGRTVQLEPGAIQAGTFELEGPGWLGGFLLRLAWALVAGTLLVLLLPRQTTAVTDTLRAAPLVSLGWGVALLVLVPVLVLVLLITVIGVPVALTLAALYAITLYLSQIIVGITLAQLAMNLGGVRPAGSERLTLWLAMLIGVSVVLLLRLLPISFGWTFWTSLLVAVMALGAVWTALTGWGRPPMAVQTAGSAPLADPGVVAQDTP